MVLPAGRVWRWQRWVEEKGVQEEALHMFPDYCFLVVMVMAD
jgi:hypothetical protein